MAFSTIKNSQNADIKIPDSCILEIYKDSITTSNSLGYSILPLKDITNIEQAISNRVNEVRPLGYSKLAILAGENNILFNHCIVYCIFYNGDVAPTYPATPAIERLPEPTNSLNVWEDLTITNNGAKEADLDLYIETIVSNDKKVEFYINDIYYLVLYNGNTNTIEINTKGVFIDGIQTDQFKMKQLPTLSSGENHIRIKKTNINKLTINYNLIY